MFKNYIKIAWRSLKNQPFFTFLNTFGLAIGMAGVILISLFIYDEFNYDNSYKDASRIHRINADIKFGGDPRAFAEVASAMAEAMQNDIPQIELTTRFRNRHSILIRKSSTEVNVKESNATFVDNTFFEMFSFSLLYGDVKTALKQPNTLILTKTAAEKHFGIAEAVGQTLLLNNTDTYTVTGVIEDMPKNSLLREHNVFMAMESWADAQSGNWTSHDYPTFIKLIPKSSVTDIQPTLDKMFGKYIIPFAQATFPGITEEQFLAAGNYLNYNTIPITDIHLYSNRFPEFSANSDIKNIYILSFIGLFLILLAAVNFMNLSTASSLKRAKEVGIRKTLGSNKSALIRQFLTESGLITFMSLVVAVILAFIALPGFNILAGKTVEIPFTNPFFWGIVILSTIILALLSGSYPAFFMSKFSPVKVLKGGSGNSIGGTKIRNSLVVFQFAISIFLIVSTLVVYQQLNYIQNKDLGYAKDKIIVIEDINTVGDKIQTFKQEVQQLGQVSNTTVTGYLPTPSYRRDNSFFREGKMGQEDAIQMQNWHVDHDYLKTLDIKLIAGRNFDKTRIADSLSMLINEAAVAKMGITPEEALGLRIKQPSGDQSTVFSTIIGVIKDFHFDSLRKDITPLSLHLGGGNGMLAVKINAENLSNTMASIESTWKTISKGQPFNYYFLNTAFNDVYQEEKKLGQIFITFTFLSIFIACLGLFGLAAFNAEKRIKEIGIRKVLGASIGQISYKLSVDFLKLVAVAILVALPLGWYAMNTWLEDFSYRIDIPWWVYVLSAFLAISISILTVSYQSIKAALVNPVKSLRSE